MTYFENGDLAQLVEFLARRDFPALEECRIKVFACKKEKKSRGMQVYADTEKLSDKLSALTGIDFIITFYDGWAELSKKALEILCIHELHHVGFRVKSDGTVEKKIIPHDVQDFFSVIEAFGLDWICAEDE